MILKSDIFPQKLHDSEKWYFSAKAAWFKEAAEQNVATNLLAGCSEAYLFKYCIKPLPKSVVPTLFGRDTL